MEARIDYANSEVLQKFAKHIISAGRSLEQSTLPRAVSNLVLIRVSQINGCSVCLDMHTKDAEHDGETPLRLHLVAAWRDTKAFTDAERAALAISTADRAANRVVVFSAPNPASADLTAIQDDDRTAAFAVRFTPSA